MKYKPFAGVICPIHGKVDIDTLEYDRQMEKPDVLWKCPKCGEVAQFDDERFEEINF